MTENAGEPQRQIQVLEERFSRLSAAVVRISSSLDLDTVLQEVVDSARALTSARYGVIVTVNDTGHIEEFVTSGFSLEEKAQMASWSDGPRLFEHFRDLQAPLRLADLPSYVQALGFSADLMRSNTFQGTPIRHRGAHVGNFFLAEKDGPLEFTSADEEILVLFASQAATAIANARTHRDEQRARADLEALIETSPVGVVVMDARAGRPVSFNREARRIVESLRISGRSDEQLQEVISVRRADGRDVSLAEIPLEQTLRTGETVRAEEVVLSVPDGRSVRTLINATPIQAADGAVESVVVTLQDLAPLEELERLRAEFLGIVSHELRTPLISIKGAATTVLEASPPPDPAEMLQFFRVINEQADRMRGLIGDLLDHGRIVTGTLSVSPEPAEVAVLVDQARSTFQSGGKSHALSVDLPEDLPWVMADRGRIAQVLNNLLSNAARHSPESSSIRVSAARDGVYVAVSVSDKGRGVPADRLPHLFRKHAAATGGEGNSGPGGAGLGLAICKGLVEAHGGRIWAESGGAGRGTRFTFTLPVVEGARDGAAGQERHRPQPSPGGKEQTHILVVDDDPQTLRYVRNALADGGYAPVVTGDPEELPGLVRMHRPALVLLDLRLPQTDGIELLKRAPELEGLPVIFISAYGREETIVKALNAGAADYIVKPFSPSELTARVRAALRRKARTRVVRPRRTDHRVRPTPGRRGGTAGGTDRYRVRTAPRALHQRGTGADLRRAALAGMAQAGWRLERPEGLGARARGRQAAAPQAGRRHGRLHLHPQRPRRRLPNARTERPLRPRGMGDSRGWPATESMA